MAKGFARTGILLALVFAIQDTRAATLGDLPISEIMANPAAVSAARGEWFELFNSSGETLNLRDAAIDDDGRGRHRIETDLLIMPGYYQGLASGRPGIFTVEDVAGKGRDRESIETSRITGGGAA